MGEFNIRPLEQQDILSNNISAATLPYSGYTKVSKKLDNFVFNEAVGNEYKLVDKNQYIKFGDKVVDTYGPELVTNGDFSDGTTGWAYNIDYDRLTNGSMERFAGDVNNLMSTPISYIEGHTYEITFDVIHTGGYSATNVYGDIFGLGIVTLANGYGTRKAREVVTAQATGTAYLNIFTIANFRGFIDNISVKEIQTVDYSNDMPDVVISTDGNAPSEITEGKFVVLDKPELVTNGTFDSDADWDSWVITGGYATREGAVDNYLSQSTPLILLEGATYTIEYEVVGNASSLILANLNGDYPVSGAIGVHSYNITVDLNVELRFYNTSNIQLDNISVTQVNDIFRATETITSGTSLTDARFQDRTQYGVTNKILSYHAMEAGIYTGVKTAILYEDVWAKDDVKTMMSNNGYSEVSEFLYSKGSELVVPIGYWDSLNSGAYHPIYNNFGTSVRWYGIEGNRVLWYDKTSSGGVIKTSVECFSPTSFNTDSSVVNDETYSAKLDASAAWRGRPDSRVYDIVYPDQYRSCVQIAKVITDQERELLVKDKMENGVGDMVVTKQYEQVATSPNSSYILVNPNGAAAGMYEVGELIDIQINFAGTITQMRNARILSVQPDGYINVEGLKYDRVAGESVYIIKALPTQSSNTSLSTEIIGDPANYPQDWLDRLASGVGLIGVNPLLVGQDGADYTNYAGYVILSDKATSGLVRLTSPDSGGSWDSLTPTLTPIDNIMYGASTDGRIGILQTSSKNLPLQIKDPLPIKLDVKPKVVFNSSHSIYKGAGLTNMTGKIATSDGAVGFQSKTLENTVQTSYDYVDTDGTITTSIVGFTTLCTGNNPSGVVNHLYARNDGFVGLINQLTADFQNAVYTDLGQILTPTHTANTLTPSTSSASKSFETIAHKDGVLNAQYFIEELAVGSNGDTGDFSQLVNGTKEDWNGNTVRTICASVSLEAKGDK